MPCQCSDSPDAFYLDSSSRGFSREFEPIESMEWVTLYRCASCNSLWAIDEWDKYSWQVAARVTDIEGWYMATEAQRKRLLLDSRGGEDSTNCIWLGCGRRRVKGVSYCIDHLYATGARK